MVAIYNGLLIVIVDDVEATFIEINIIRWVGNVMDYFCSIRIVGPRIRIISDNFLIEANEDSISIVNIVHEEIMDVYILIDYVQVYWIGVGNINILGNVFIIDRNDGDMEMVVTIVDNVIAILEEKIEKEIGMNRIRIMVDITKVIENYILDTKVRHDYLVVLETDVVDVVVAV